MRAGLAEEHVDTTISDIARGIDVSIYVVNRA